MKKIYTALGWLVLFCCLSLPSLAFDSIRVDKNPIDPVFFKLESSHKEVTVGQTFRLTITAYINKYVSLGTNPGALDMGYTLKLIFPEGFVQTGGDYRDDLEGRLSTSKPYIKYTVEGKFLSKPGHSEFRLIRGAKNSKVLNKYILKATFSPTVKDVIIKSSTESRSLVGGCVVNKVRLWFRWPDECCMDRLIGAKIQGSNDGSTWTDLYTFSSSGTGAWQDFTFSNTTAYEYARFQSSSTGWGELVELEFYNGTTKLSGTPFGTDNYLNAFDGNGATNWHAPSSAGTHNVAGLEFTSCSESSCSTPEAPSISKTSGTTVCAAASQSVSLTATGCSGTVTWYNGATVAGTGSILTTTTPGTYTAKCTVSGCESVASSGIVVSETSGCAEEGCVVNRVKLVFRDPEGCCMDRLVGAKIQGSNDGSTWTDLYTFTSNGNGSWQDFTFTNTTPYAYARFRASATGWGELRELEFYNGSTKLSGTAFGTDNYTNAFDGNTSTEWHAVSSAGTDNVAGLEFSGCSGGGCSAPAAPSISKTSGTTVCASTSQSVTLTATGCSGTVTWYNGATVVGTGATLTTTAPGSYTATCKVAECESVASSAITVSETSGCDAGSACVVNKVRLWFRGSGDCCMDRLVGAKIQGSNNGSSWTDLYTFTSNGNGAWQDFTFSNTTPYAYARFVASSTGWGELRELEFYNGSTKLDGTSFGTDNYVNAFDGNTSTEWHGLSSAGNGNVAGLQFTSCSGSSCTAPAAPSVSKTAGTTVCPATGTTVTLSATGCAGTVKWYRGGTLILTGASLVTSTAGVYTATCTLDGCESVESSSINVVQDSSCSGAGGTDLLGSYRTIAGGREYTYNKTPVLELQFNSDGTISDVTPGINKTGSIATLDGKKVYYMIGYTIFADDEATVYRHFDSVYLPDGVYTIRQFVCDAGLFPDLAAFKSKISGWDNGVNATNSSLSEIFLSIKTIGASTSDVKSIVPDWLKVSRHMRYQNYSANKNWQPYSKYIGIVYRNQGTNPGDMQSKGLLPELNIDIGAAYQPNTWYTPGWHTEEYISNTDLYNSGKFWIEFTGNTPSFVLTDQIGEKVAPVDPGNYNRMNYFYQGAFEQLQATNSGITDKRQTGLYGPYNSDDYNGLLTPEILGESRTAYEQSLTTNLYNTWDPSTRSWTSNIAAYYSSGQINYRNVNHMMYLWNNVHHIPYRFIYINERVKLGTKTYGGVDRESNWIAFTWNCVQNMVYGSSGFVGIEYNSTGEIIPFPNGEITSRQNLAIPAPWDEWITLGFWSTLVGNGFLLWEAPRARLGVDSTQLDWYDDAPGATWTPTAGSSENYTSGVNGAPVKSILGLKNRLWASPQDAALAGSDMVWEIKDRVTSLSHCSYSSSEGSFTAIPGSTGLHLNGFGPLNVGQYVVKDAFDQKKGIALFGTGSGGSVVVYYNGFLAPHEYEDNVTISTPSGSVNIGRVYGRQTMVKKL